MAKNKETFRISEEKRRILLVEDELINQEIIRESLAQSYELLIAQSGEEALQIIGEQHETLSVVLLDLNLPGVRIALMPPQFAYSIVSFSSCS